MKPKTLLTAAAAALVAILAMPSHAGFISGEVSVGGTFSKLPDVGDSTIVSDLSFLNIDHSATVLSAGTGAFASIGLDAIARGNNINLGPLQPIHFSYTVGEFTFLATGVSNFLRPTPVCTATACTDTLTFDIAGVVSGPAFSTTAFTGTWYGVGSCTALDNKCISDVAGSWHVYLDPPVLAQVVPEPGSVALLGLTLGVLGWVIRRRKL
jgi:hypothetical protein